MILTRNEIRALLQKKTLEFEPALDQFQNQPHAVDLRLGTTFYIPKIWQLTPQGRTILNVDVTKEAGHNYETVQLQMGQYFELAPGESIIASTLEKITLKEPDIMGILYPRSSINRRGLSVDLTGIVDAFYSGSLMIPILNKTTSQIIRVYPGERICQIVFQKLVSPLGENEALQHGNYRAKYHECPAEALTSKKDQDIELEYIKTGNLQGLKAHPYQ